MSNESTVTWQIQYDVAVVVPRGAIGTKCYVKNLNLISIFVILS